MGIFSIANIWTLRDELVALLLALRDVRTPVSGKVFAIASVVYLISPIDILLDTIPLAGILDDLVVVPLGVWLSHQRIPDEVLKDAREEAKKYHGKLNTVAAVILGVIGIWIISMLALVFLVVRMFIS